MISYQLHGDASKPTLVLLHGFLGNQADWDSVCLKMLLEYSCLTIDLPGHGGMSISEQNNSLPKAAKSINELLDDLAIPTCHLLGYSMGGRVALQMVLQNPERYLSLTMEGSCPGLKTLDEQAKRVKHDEYIARQIEKEQDNFRGYLIKWYEQPFFKSIKRNPELFKEFLKPRLTNKALLVAQALRALSTGAQPSLWGRLHEVSCPVLLIVGENDSKFFGFAEDMLRGFSQSQLHVLSDCGHNVHVEKVADYVRILTNFLNL